MMTPSSMTASDFVIRDNECNVRKSHARSNQRKMGILVACSKCSVVYIDRARRARGVKYPPAGKPASGGRTN